MTQSDPPSPFGNDPDAIHRLFIEMLPPDVHLIQLLGEWLPADQLKAIKELLHRNHQAAEASRIKFDELRQLMNATPDNEQLDRLHDDRFWSRVFMDSAHSMSAVGMLAPFMESLFVAIFAGFRRWQVEDLGGTRRQRADDQFWNPQIYFEKDMPKVNLVKGIEQLAVSCGLQSYLPADYEKTLAALFAYRNNMFHNGFLWPAETINKFSNRVTSEKWPDTWFTSVDSCLFTEVCSRSPEQRRLTGPENIGPERTRARPLGRGKVNSHTRITPENNGKIRPQPDRENAFVRASGGQRVLRITSSAI